MKTIILAALLASNAAAATVTLTMNEVPYQRINGLVVNKGGIGFTFTDATNQDYYNTGDGGQERFVQDPCIEGPTSSAFQVAFSAPVWSFSFGFALSTYVTVPTAVTVALFNNNYRGGAAPFLVQTASSQVFFTFSEGSFTYNGSRGPVNSIVVIPNAGAAVAIGFDNLTVNTTPVMPSTIPLTMDELPNQLINGLNVYKGALEFSFTDPSNSATYNSSDGGQETYVQDPSILGRTADPFTVAFSFPVYSVRFGIALSTTSPVSPLVTVNLYNNSATPFAAVSANSLALNPFANGVFTYAGKPVTKIQVEPNSGPAAAFGFDNLAVSPTPDGGIAAAPNGSIYAVDSTHNRVLVYDSTGVLRLTFGTVGKGPGQFTLPTGIALVTSGGAVTKILVADAGNNRVQVFDAQGHYQFQFGGTGTGNGQLQQPLGIAVLPAGTFAVVDSANNRVQIFTALGDYQSQFGSAGTNVGQFQQPTGIAVLPSGLIAVSDSWNSRIEMFDALGHFHSEFGIQGAALGQMRQPIGIAALSNGNLAVADGTNNRISVFNTNGVFQFGFGGPGINGGEFNAPAGIAATSTGLMWVLDQGNERRQQFDNFGNYRAQGPLN